MRILKCFPEGEKNAHEMQIRGALNNFHMRLITRILEIEAAWGKQIKFSKMFYKELTWERAGGRGSKY